MRRLPLYFMQKIKFSDFLLKSAFCLTYQIETLNRKICRLLEECNQARIRSGMILGWEYIGESTNYSRGLGRYLRWDLSTNTIIREQRLSSARKLFNIV